ncbi:MAG: MATE family efflux transporter [Firmicutes bacterium]|nr:MATE family efflux transporter [Bacillota bacterium]MCM1400595.1 MATE family efflux transporter [Bacteroides sp.]
MNLDLKITRLGLPILVGQAGSIIVGFADTAMVGHYGTPELASASFVNNLFNVAIFTLLGFSYGLTPLVGALFGRKQQEATGALMRTALWTNVAFGVLVVAVMTVIYLNIHRLGQPQELLPLIAPYFLIYLGGLIPLCVFNAFAQWAYAINRTRMPMWIILISNVMNIAGNYVFIFGHCGCPVMGLNGAGLSTLIARGFCAVAIVAVFLMQKDYAAYRRGYKSGKLNLTHFKEVNYTSWPVAMQMGFEAGSFTVAAIMAGWLGALELAAYQVMVILGTLGFCLYYSMGAATSVLVANAAGQRDVALMRRTAFAGYRIILIMATCSSLIFIFAAEPIVNIFTSDCAVISLSLTLVVPLVIYQLGDATQITFANALRGTSHVMPMLWISLVCYGIVGVPATYLLGIVSGLGLYGIVLSFSVSLFLAGALFLYFFLKTTKTDPKTL